MEFFAEEAKIDPRSVYRHLTEVSPNPFSCFYSYKGDWIAKSGFGGQGIGKKLVVNRYFFCDFFFYYNKISLVCAFKGIIPGFPNEPSSKSPIR